MRVALVPPAPGVLPHDCCAVAIDVLRATTTLAVARARGAARIVPFGSTAEAIAWRDAHPGTLACGERDGRIVPGFDLGNSPSEYTRERVAGATLAFASTNGSRAMLAASRTRRRLLASFANLSAITEALTAEPDVWLVCAGKLGRFALEDAACAGTIAWRLRARGATLDTAATMAATLACTTPAEVRAAVMQADHGRWLTSLGEGFPDDVEYATRSDHVSDATSW